MALKQSFTDEFGVVHPDAYWQVHVKDDFKEQPSKQPKLKAYCLVFHDKEIERIRERNFFQPTANGGRLNVTEPILGMRYCLYWTPLKEVDYRPLLAT